MMATGKVFMTRPFWISGWEAGRRTAGNPPIFRGAQK
jgi:hypothetical protein